MSVCLAGTIFGSVSTEEISTELRITVNEYFIFKQKDCSGYTGKMTKPSKNNRSQGKASTYNNFFEYHAPPPPPPHSAKDLLFTSESSLLKVEQCKAARMDMKPASGVILSLIAQFQHISGT